MRSAAPPRPAVGELVGGFVEPLARMLIVAAGLRLAVDGAVTGRSATAPERTTADGTRPELHVPPTEDLDPGQVGAVRADVATPIVNSVWRVAAARDVLADARTHFGPITHDDAFRHRARAVLDDAERAAAGLGWPVVATPAALEHHGLADAAPSVRAVLDAYRTTLPRVLTLVASSRAAASERGAR
jgi:hypothetical protein